MTKEFRRERCLKKLVAKKGNGKVKVITGMRKVGKSYLLNTIFYRYLIENQVQENHIIRFAFDSAKDLLLLGENLIDLEKENRKVDPKKFMDFIASVTKEDGNYYLLLDEVQLMDCFETVLISYLNQSNLDLYVTGSNAKFLSKDIISEFSGKGDEIHVAPLTFSEFMSLYPKDKYEGMSEYMLYGGMPSVVLEEDKEEKAILLNRLFTETYLSDIVKRYHVRNEGILDDLLNVLSSSVGSLTNPEKLSNTFRSLKKADVSPNTIRRYISYFEDAFLIESTSRYDVKGKAYIDTPKKYFFSDLGLRNARLQFRQFEKTHLMENLIYNELLTRGYSVDVGVVMVNEKNGNGNYVRKQLEVDFVCNRGFQRYYIQSAFSMPDIQKEKQECRPLIAIDDSFQKIIITSDVTPIHYNENGVLIVNIYDFLFEEKVLL